MRLLLLAAAVACVGCDAYVPSKTSDDDTRATRHLNGVRAIAQLNSDGICWVDFYFADGSKYYAGSVDARICAK